AAAQRRARGGEPVARGRRDRHGHDPAAPGRYRGRAAHRPGNACAVPARRPRAGARAAALHPGNHHQCGAPRTGHRAATGIPLRWPRRAPAGPRQRPWRRGGGARQRAARHARAARGLRWPGRTQDRAGRGVRAGTAPAAGQWTLFPGAARACRSWSDPMIRICLVDDQTLVRQGIRSLLALAEGVEVVAEAADGKQAVELIPQARPDVVLMDMRMPVMSGLEALQALARINALPPTIILTTFDDDQLVLAG